MVVVMRIGSACGGGSVCSCVRCDNVLFWWRFALMYGWGMGRCFVGLVLAEEVVGDAHGCGGDEGVVVVCEWSGVSVLRVLSTSAECVSGGVE